MCHSSDSCSLTDQGCQRDNNEDTYLELPEKGLWVVADGMGGHAAGEVASAIVVTSIISAINRGQSLSEAIVAAHRSVLEGVLEGIGQVGMGSTVVALRSQGQDYEIAWVGDSRAYLWSQSGQGGDLQRLSRDHSYVQALVDRGVIDASEMDQHPDRNVITQCLGSSQQSKLRIDRITGTWCRNQWVLLCSDGLTNEVPDQQIADIMCQSQTPEEAAKNLLQAALEHGGHDNITVQVIPAPKNACPPNRTDDGEQGLWGKLRQHIPWMLTVAVSSLPMTATFWTNPR